MSLALRSLLRSPAFALAAVLTIALGVGVNSAVFSVIYQVILDPLPFREPDRLVHIAETHPEFPSLQVAAPDFFDWRRSAGSFEAIAAHTLQAMNQGTLLGHGEPIQVHAANASHDLFPMLGVTPLLGRWYTAEEELQQRPVMVISESLWRREFSSDPAVLGKSAELSRVSFTVIGVVPQRQAFPVWADLWIPLSMMEAQLKEIRRFHPLEVVARLKPGVSLEQGQAEMQAIAAALAKEHPDTNGVTGVSTIPLASQVTGGVQPTLLIAWAAVTLVLLLAYANVSHLVLLRSIAKSKEVAIRAALGASRRQLIACVIAENLWIGVAGAGIGLVLAACALPVLRDMAHNEIPRIETLSLNPAVMLFTTLATLVCALLFSLPACLQVLKNGIQTSIRQSSGPSITQRRSWFGLALIAAEIALSFVVLSGATLLYRSFRSLVNEDPGFRSDHVLAMEVTLLAAHNWEQAAQLFETRFAPAIRALPGVDSVAAANTAPMGVGPTELSRYATRFGVEGRTFEPGKFPVAQLRWVTSEYFRTLSIPLRSGRLLDARDAGRTIWVINETLARNFFPNESAVGKRLISGVVSPQPNPVEIAGVVGDVRDLALDLEPRPTIYSIGVSPRMTFLVRTDAEPWSLIQPVRDAIRAADPLAPAPKVAPLRLIIDESLARRRFALTLLAVFASLASLLTAIGIYGVIAYAVTRRTREFGIRTALGARPSDQLALVLREYLLPASMGLAAGTWLSYVFATGLRTLLYKHAPAEAGSLIITAAVLLALALLSAMVPARRAAAVQPASALRAE